MSRRKGRANKPPHINGPVRHHEHCVCDRCIEEDTKRLEKSLEESWEKYNRENGVQQPRIRVTIRESPVIGPWPDKKNTDEARFVTCPDAIVWQIAPMGKRRK